MENLQYLRPPSCVADARVLPDEKGRRLEAAAGGTATIQSKGRMGKTD
jgi:hypothetical protein